MTEPHPTLMLAAERERYGLPDVVELRKIPVPTPAEGEVLVRVHVTSVNRADLDAIKPRPGFMRLFMGLRGPRQRGFGTDAAGVVERVGAGVTTLKPGDRVFGDMFVGGRPAFAEYVCTVARAFRPIPQGMSFETAATLPHSGVLALQSLRLRDGRTLPEGARVLVDGATGNVGPFVVQIAKSVGAHVTGVGPGAKEDFVRSLGADEFVDYETVDYTTTGERYDWIVDTDTHHPLRHARRALTPGGAHVTLGGGTRQILAGMVAGQVMSRRSDRWSGLLLWWKPMHGPDVERLLDLVASGAVTPRIDRRYAFADLVDALRWVEDGRARGKVIVTMPAGESR